MTAVFTVAAWVMLAFAAVVVVGNYLALLASWRNKRSGDPHHVSTVPVLSLLLCGLSSLLRTAGHSGHPPNPLLAAVALLDPALWSLISWPLYVVIRRARRL